MYLCSIANGRKVKMPEMIQVCNSFSVLQFLQQVTYNVNRQFFFLDLDGALVTTLGHFIFLVWHFSIFRGIGT